MTRFATLTFFVLAAFGATAGFAKENARKQTDGYLAKLDAAIARTGAPAPAQRFKAAPICQDIESIVDGATAEPGRPFVDSILNSIDGFAGNAQTVGGLHSQIYLVTDLSDYDLNKREPAVSGTLRYQIDAIKKSGRGGWIVFRPRPGGIAELELTKRIELPSNTTIDGGCAMPVISSPPKEMILYGKDVENIVVSGLTMIRRGPMDPDDQSLASCMRFNGNVDGIAVLNNSLSNCADGMIDITVSPGAVLPPRGRYTIARNYFSNHTKVMLFGTFGCKDKSNGLSDGCGVGVRLPPRLFLTLRDNIFNRTAQRHPRVFDRAYAHIYNNIIIFNPVRKPDGKLSDGYGVLVTNGARALLENNIMLPGNAVNRKDIRNVYTTTWKGANLGSEFPGYFRLKNNLLDAESNPDENKPELVEDPDYRRPALKLPISPASLDATLNCIVQSAGPGGRVLGPACPNTR